MQLKFLKLKKIDHSDKIVIVHIKSEEEEKDKRKILVGKNLPTHWFPIKEYYNHPEVRSEKLDPLP